MRKVRTYCCCSIPIVPLRIFRIIKCSIRINISTYKTIDIHIHITTYVETVRHIILSFTKIKKIAITIIAHIAVETRAFSTTSNFSRYFRTIIRLLYIIRRIIIDIRITIRIQSRTMIIDLLCCIKRLCSRIIIQKSFIIKGHIFGRTQIFRICLSHMKSCISSNTNI